MTGKENLEGLTIIREGKCEHSNCSVFYEIHKVTMQVLRLNCAYLNRKGDKTPCPGYCAKTDKRCFNLYDREVDRKEG